MLTAGSWVVVADAAQARIFKARSEAGDLEHFASLDHPEQRAHTRDLRTGGKGEQHDSSNTSVHQSDPQTTTMEKHADIFARKLADKLSKARHEEQFERMTLVAAPAFLGRLRDNLDEPTRACIEQEIDKNWGQHKVEDIESLLQKKPAE